MCALESRFKSMAFVVVARQLQGRNVMPWFSMLHPAFGATRRQLGNRDSPLLGRWNVFLLPCCLSSSLSSCVFCCCGGDGGGGGGCFLTFLGKIMYFCWLCDGANDALPTFISDLHSKQAVWTACS